MEIVLVETLRSGLSFVSEIEGLCSLYMSFDHFPPTQQIGLAATKTF